MITNGLFFQIAKLIEDSPSNSKNAIEEKVILDWLVEQKVLSIALEGIEKLECLLNIKLVSWNEFFVILELFT